MGGVPSGEVPVYAAGVPLAPSVSESVCLTPELELNGRRREKGGVDSCQVQPAVAHGLISEGSQTHKKRIALAYR